MIQALTDLLALRKIIHDEIHRSPDHHILQLMTRTTAEMVLRQIQPVIDLLERKENMTTNYTISFGD